MNGDEEQGKPQSPASSTADPGATGKPETSSQGGEPTELRHDTATDAGGTPSASRRKIAANRRNSQKSTGPKTSAGKKKVSRNAIKHGFYSKYLLVQDGHESQREYHQHYMKIVRHYMPVGWGEENCVEIIAAWSLRLRRVLRHEAGQIARAVAEQADDVQRSKLADTEEPGAEPSSSGQLDAMTDHLFLTFEGLEVKMRHEAMVHRQLNHAVAELERLQARRRGQPTEK